MKKAILSAVVVLLLASCHSSERRARVSEAYTSTADYKFHPYEEIQIQYVDTMLHAGDVYTSYGTLYMVR